MNGIRRRVKDPFPGLSHWLGAVLSVAGLVAMVTLASGDLWRVVGCTIYGATLIVLYGASALAHTFTARPRRRTGSRGWTTWRFSC